MLGNLFGPKKDHPPVVQSTQGDVQPPVAPSPVSQQATPTDVASSQVSSDMTPRKREDLSVLSHLDTRSSAILNHAQQEATRLKKEKMEPEQLLYGLLFDGDIFTLLDKNSVQAAKVSEALQQKETMGSFEGSPTMGDGAKKVFEDAYQLAKQNDSEFVSPEHLFIALYNASSTAAFLKEQGLPKEKIEETITKSGGMSMSKKSVLDKYGVDLCEQARQGELDPITGRDREIERLIHILLRRTKNNPIIIGEAGVGKTALVEGLAEAIVKGSAPKELSNKRIIQLDVSALIAGASHRGEFEERLRSVIKETQLSEGTVVLFIDEIHTLIGTGDQQGAMDASNIIKPYLARGQLQLIGTTTVAEYRKYFEKDKAFERRFQPILVDEPSEEVAIQMIKTLQAKYEKFHGITFSEEAIQDAVHLSKRYIGERFLPDKAVDVLDEAAANVKLQHSSGKRTDTIVKSTDIQGIISSWTGIPITKLTEDEGQKLLHLEDLIHKKLIDQQAAVRAVSEAVRRGRIGLSSANRPIASFIFLGPTGVGKTELSKVLAGILFGKEDAMIRLDMSEYMEKHEVAKLIGAPPGYVGYEEGGHLTEAVRAKPYSIVLLDEIEKAHPDVFNILLQVLEDGRLTDNKGNTISFKNTIIIATSNIGSALIQQQLHEANKGKPEFEKEFASLTQVLVQELHKFFKPELLNRFDEVVVFEPLAQSDMVAVARLNIEKTQKLLEEQKIKIVVTEKALQELAKEGYDPQYGARPLRRLIQNAVENPIAVLIIGRQFIAGDTISVDYDSTKQEFTFSKAATAPAQPGQANQQPQQPPVQQAQQNGNGAVQTPGNLIQQPHSSQVPTPPQNPQGAAGASQAA